MEEYKVRYSQNGIVKVTEWEEKEKATKKFNKLKNEKVVITEWADLIYSPLDENAEDEEIVIDSFGRRKKNILGKEILLK